MPTPATVSGIVYDGATIAKVGAVLVVTPITVTGEIVSNSAQKPVSGALGAIEFDVHQGGHYNLSGNLLGFGSAGINVVIPNEAEVELTSLMALAVIPTQGLTLKDEGTALASLIGTINITGAGASLVQASAGVATLNIPGIGSSNFVDLADVTFTGLASGQFPRYNGTAWVNAALLAADIPSLSATYSLAGHNHSGVYQPLDADLSTIAALGTASQQLRTNAAGNAVEWFTPAASGAAWGDITGTLADQTDLQNALDLKANLTANTFTRLQTITQGTANEGILASTGYSLTGSDTTPMLDLAGTWNTSGLATGIKLNITNTASGAGSLLLDLQLNNATYFGLRKTGSMQVAAGLLTGFVSSVNYGVDIGNVDTGIQMVSGAKIGWTGSATNPTMAPDALLVRATAKVLSFDGASSTGSTFRAIPTRAAQITGDVNNYNPAGSSHNLFLSTDASRSVTGLAFTAVQVDGQEHFLWNNGAFDLVLANESASSTAANRFTTNTGADITIPAKGVAVLCYDGTTSRWRAALL